MWQLWWMGTIPRLTLAFFWSQTDQKNKSWHHPLDPKAPPPASQSCITLCINQPLTSVRWTQLPYYPRCNVLLSVVFLGLYQIFDAHFTPRAVGGGECGGGPHLNNHNNSKNRGHFWVVSGWGESITPFLLAVTVLYLNFFELFGEEVSFLSPDSLISPPSPNLGNN